MKPLAERMRPQTLDDIQGQNHLIGTEGVLRKALQRKELPSLILWGSPGTGKTTLARILAREAQLPYRQLSAIDSGVKELRQVISEAKMMGKLLIFIDEIHRFNTTQQDALLGAVEAGVVVLIGATTENPSFEINNALLSRCQVFTLNPLAKEDLEKIIHKALLEDTLLNQKEIVLEETEALFRYSSGDARKLLNLFELCIGDDERTVITNKLVKSCAQRPVAFYDKKGDNHYDLLSAYIKSIRGSDPNAAIYYLACLLEGGEDLQLIARRLVISASEDIGLAEPNALVVASACFNAVKNIGLPEARIPLAEVTIFLANSPKSNSAYKAMDKAMEYIREHGKSPVPLHLHNTPQKLLRQLNGTSSEQYLYSHNGKDGFIYQEFLPDDVKETFYTPSLNNDLEEQYKTKLQELWGNKYDFNSEA